MFKFAKLCFLLSLIFVGLYFFGDFRINDTNVKQYLQRQITFQRVQGWQQDGLRFFRHLMRLYENEKGSSAPVQNVQKKTVPSSQLSKTSPNQIKVKKQPKSISKPKIQEDLAGTDRILMKRILRQNISQKP